MIIAVDFDGTLCESAWPGIGAPRENVIAALKARKQNGAKIILWTCRTGHALEVAVEWCKAFGVVFDAVNENLQEITAKFGESRKVFADEYWDDKAVHPNTFKGEYRKPRRYIKGRG